MMRKLRFLFLLTSFNAVAVLFFSAAFISCSFIRTSDEVQLILPGDFESEFWDITWLSYDGSVLCKRVSRGSTTVICIPRELPVVVSAAPVMPESLFPFQIKPAGCVVSAGEPSCSIIELSWKQGFEASFLLNLAASGIPPDAVNIRRFVETVESRSNGNPWNLDLNRLSYDLLSGDIWVYSFKQLQTFEVTIPLPVGIWYPEYPLEKELKSDSGFWNGEITIGVHNFVRKTDGMVVSVSVDERGQVVVFSGSCQLTGFFP